MKKSLFFAALCFLMVSLMPVKVTNGCGWYDPGYYVYTFTNPNLIEEPSYRPFFFTFMYYYDEWKGEEFAAEENLKEWRDFFQNKGAVKDFNHLIYKTSLDDLKALRDGGTLSSEMKANLVVKNLQAQPNKAFLDYMIFAKECEPLATDREFDWDGNLVNSETKGSQSSHLIQKGLKAFDACSSEFLKLRYAFQVVRLARYSMEWQNTIRIYEDLMPQVENVNSIIRYWTMEHYAGALYNLDRKAEASYHFARVFDNCASRRKAAYTSFEITSDKMWEETLNLCKNDNEKASLYVLRAISPFSNAVEEMKEIYNFNPTSPHLELLLMREMQKFEYELLGASYNKSHDLAKYTGYDYNTNESYVRFPRQDNKKYLSQLVDFSKKVKSEGKVAHPHLWELAAGYLTFMNGDAATAMKMLNQLSNNKSLDENFQNQIKVFKAAIEVASFTKMDNASEMRAMELMPLLKSVRSPYWGDSNVSEQADYLMDRIAVLYQKQGDHAKAYLCKKWGFGNLLYGPNLQVVEGLLSLYDRKNSFNAFEKELTKPVFYKGEWTSNGLEFKEQNTDIKNELLEMKGTILLGRNQLEDAIATFEQLPQEYQRQDFTFDQEGWQSPNNSRERYNISNRNPFHLYTYDNQLVPVNDPTFNKMKLAKTLQKLEQHIQNKGENLAEAYFMLGNIHFQTSFHGKAWRAKSYAWGYEGQFQDNEDALRYLNKAIEIGNKNDREWAAKACFVASACRNKDNKTNQKEYFSKLKNEYSDTEFYQQAIKECYYFYDFVY